MRPAASGTVGSIILVVGILIGAGGYYVATNLPAKVTTTTVTTTITENVTTTVTTATTATVTTYLTTAATNGGLYIESVVFSGGNVTVTLGNLGGGIPTPPGYGDTGAIARYVAAVIIGNGSVYYHYNWNCQLNTSCALAPGPYRFFSLTGTTRTLTETWNLGNSSLVPDILSVGGTLSAVVTFPWSPGETYTIYLQSNDSSIVYQQAVTAPV